MFGKFVKFTAEMFSECQNVDRIKIPAKTLMHVFFIHLYAPRVYVTFILDMKIVFNKIINNSRPPARMEFFSDQDGKQGIYNYWPYIQLANV